MKQTVKYGLLPIILIFPLFIFSQDSDTSNVEESSRESYTSVDFSYSRDKGNTDLDSRYYGFSYTLIGDAGPLTDTEFSINYSRSNDILDNEPFTDDQSITSQFDLWANQRISPFLFFQQSYDKTIGLENRMNAGAGGKIRLLKGFSISYAFLFENESYTTRELSGIDSSLVEADGYYYYEDFYEYDTTYSVGATDSSFFRHSIRPKYKVKLFDGNLVFDYRFYYKPRVDNFDDYLLEHELKISLATFYDALSIDLNYTNKYNSRYDGVVIINNDTGMPYKDVDSNLSLGFSLAL